jgi:hypothetical protein
MKKVAFTKENGKTVSSTARVSFTQFTEIICKDFSLMERPMLNKPSSFTLMARITKAQSKKIDSKEATENSNINLTGPNISAIGSMTNHTAKEDRFIETEAITKESLRPVRNTVGEFSPGKTARNTKGLLQMATWRDQAN